MSIWADNVCLTMIIQSPEQLLKNAIYIRIPSEGELWAKDSSLIKSLICSKVNRRGASCKTSRVTRRAFENARESGLGEGTRNRNLNVAIF